MVHRLVAKAFILNPKNKPQINHKDGDKLNNIVSNLEWCTNLENQRHSWANGRQAVKGGDHYLTKFTEEDVRYIRYARINGTSLIVLAKKFKVGLSTISMVANKQRWGHI